MISELRAELQMYRLYSGTIDEARRSFFERCHVPHPSSQFSQSGYQGGYRSGYRAPYTPPRGGSPRGGRGGNRGGSSAPSTSTNNGKTTSLRQVNQELANKVTAQEKELSALRKQNQEE